MNFFKATVRIRSPLATPLMADTLWGHICWGIRWREGEAALKLFIESYLEEPPLVLSNPFPAGFLPKPVLPAQITGGNGDLQKYQNVKPYKKLKYLPETWLLQNEAPVCENSLQENWRREKIEHPRPKSRLRMGNGINRLSGTVEEGLLFNYPELWFEADSDLEIWIISRYSRERTRQLLEWALENGYGADVSIGKGRVELADVSPITWPEKGNRYMALAHFAVPDRQFPSDLRADIFTKYGKVGHGLGLNRNPFKKPIMLFKEGATFQADSDRLFIGGLLKDVHSNPDIVQYAAAPLIPIQTEEAAHETV
ncbi:MAG: CRISPR-associated protein, Csm4 family [Calditrichia bacterium]